MLLCRKSVLRLLKALLDSSDRGGGPSTDEIFICMYGNASFYTYIIIQKSLFLITQQSSLPDPNNKKVNFISYIMKADGVVRVYAYYIYPKKIKNRIYFLIKIALRALRVLI